MLVAVSGGPDSVALTQALVELTQEHGFELRLAHLNHQLRKGADADEAFCVQWAERLGLPLATHRIDIAREARLTRSSTEEQARKKPLSLSDEDSRAMGLPQSCGRSHS